MDEILNWRNFWWIGGICFRRNFYSTKVSSKVCRLSKTNCKYILPSIKPPYRLQLLYALWLLHIKMLDRLKWLIWSQQRKSNKFKSVLKTHNKYFPRMVQFSKKQIVGVGSQKNCGGSKEIINQYFLDSFYPQRASSECSANLQKGNVGWVASVVKRMQSRPVWVFHCVTCYKGL